MRRFTALVAVVVVAIACVSLVGCSAPTGPGPKAGSGPAQEAKFKVGTPQAGTYPFPQFLSMTAVSFSDGIAALGVSIAKDPVPAILQPLNTTQWATADIGTGLSVPYGAADIGLTQVVIGADNAIASSDASQVPFVAVGSAALAGVFTMHDVGQSAFGGKPAELDGIARTGEATAPGTQFIMVGATVSSQDGQLNDPTAMIPVAFTSHDGNTWQPTTDLPLPDGVTGADAMAVTYAPSGTAYPGVLVAGSGWAHDAQIGRRQVGIVWQSPDAGKTWNIISDDSFNQEGRGILAMFVAADSHTIMVGGTADVPGQKFTPGAAKQTEAIDWSLGSDGKWDGIVDTLEPNRSSYTNALIARPDGGFLTATQIHDENTDPATPGVGGELKGNPIAKVWLTTDGVNYTDLTPSIKDMDSAAMISGIAEFGGRVAFFGENNQSKSMAWVVNSSAVK